MAVAHAFHHDSRAIRPALENATTTVFLGDHLLPGGAPVTVVSSDPRSELTCSSSSNKNNNYDATWFVPRKRARIADTNTVIAVMEGHRALLPVPPPPQAFAPAAEDAHQQGGRHVLCSSGAAASTSGRRPAAPGGGSGILAHLYRHGVEVDALARLQNERLRAGLEEARRRHVRAVVSAVERAAARRLRAAEADLELALARNAELGEKVRHMNAEGQAWRGLATGHEAAAAGLRATLEQLLLQQQPSGVAAAAEAAAEEEGQGEVEVEDARSCCFEPEEDDRLARDARRACRACGAAEACVLLLPCRHLCLCGGCEAVLEACPVCAAARNASLHVLLS